MNAIGFRRHSSSRKGPERLGRVSTVCLHPRLLTQRKAEPDTSSRLPRVQRCGRWGRAQLRLSGHKTSGV